MPKHLNSGSQVSAETNGSVPTDSNSVGVRAYGIGRGLAPQQPPTCPAQRQSQAQQTQAQQPQQLQPQQLQQLQVQPQQQQQPYQQYQQPPYQQGYAAPQVQPSIYGQSYYQPPATSIPQQTSKKKRGAAFWIAIVVAVLAVAVVVILVFGMLFGNQKSSRSGQLGQLEGKTPEEMQAALDRVVEEGMFNISIASVVEFPDGTSEGELRIENVPGNPYLMKVDISRQDTGQKIYETDVIEQNYHIQSDTLDIDLDPGTYECVATFHALDPETEEEVGQAAAAISVRVLG